MIEGLRTTDIKTILEIRDILVFEMVSAITFYVLSLKKKCKDLWTYEDFTTKDHKKLNWKVLINVWLSLDEFTT